MASREWVELGRIIGAHGIRGQVRVRYFGDGPDNLLASDEVWLGSSVDDDAPRRFDVVSGGLARTGEARLGLQGVDDRDVAQGLRGSVVLVPVETLDALPSGEFYWHELIGCRVELEEGRSVGTVREIWDSGGHDVMVVVDDRGVQNLIPTARELVPEIDLEEQRIVVKDLPGLVDFGDDADEPGGSKG